MPSMHPHASEVPDIRITFPEGDYEFALMNYEAAKTWTLTNGLALRPDLCGTIGSPRHPSSPDAIRIVPNELLPDPHWTIAIEFYCRSDKAFDRILKEVRLPDGCTLENLRALRGGI